MAPDADKSRRRTIHDSVVSLTMMPKFVNCRQFSGQVQKAKTAADEAVNHGRDTAVVAVSCCVDFEWNE